MIDTLSLGRFRITEMHHGIYAFELEVMISISFQESEKKKKKTQRTKLITGQCSLKLFCVTNVIQLGGSKLSISEEELIIISEQL